MSKKYSSPKNDKEFEKYWNIYIPAIVERENFRELHLTQLSILCDLLVEYDKMQMMIDLEGYVVENEGRYGHQTKPSVYVLQRDKTLKEIRSYLKLLGLTLFKDEGPEEEVEDEWKE